ncbi:Right handed beta helix region [Micromonospora pallida]|uniref:Right handed beta helix region n=1 Tax=Micromonospora pallida TaxID=145854 RepID=A0A1C6S4H4_9ACTN|nr:right-handed parallel beta-helix repeat-containing protein [Micromonospora pallida]SCL24287.1 Right handed beta helix region [Micromonospora pallida]
MGDPGAPATGARVEVPLRCDAREHGLAGDGVTNDQPALAALVDRLGEAYRADGRARVVYCPPGVYAIRDAGTTWRGGVSLVGAGPGVTRFVLDNAGNRADPTPLAFHTVQRHGASPDRHLADCTFADFEIDGSRVASAEYNPLAKGLGLQYVLRGTFRNLYIHHTAATGLGCDFLQDTLIEGVRVTGCGRLDNGTQMGGAGIGVGVGGWGAVERLTIVNCTAVGNATSGIFLELQRLDFAPPRGIRIIGCHVQDNRFGIADWGADGLIVSACTMIGNLEAGFQVSAEGTTGTAGRGGIVTDCVVDDNLRAGVSIGNTPGPYIVRGNRISGNGRYGYHQENLGEGYRAVSRDIVIESNDIWGNSLDGIRIDRPIADAVLLDNRIRNNGRQCAPAACGAGDAVGYTDRTLTDRSADWPHDGHRGKVVRVGRRIAVVAANDSTTLHLAAIRPGSHSAWSGDTPAPGTPYELPGSPPVRAGLTVDARCEAVTVRGNRMWDNHTLRTQDHGFWVTGRGGLVDCRIEGNDLAGNGLAGVLLETPPTGGRWVDNHAD